MEAEKRETIREEKQNAKTRKKLSKEGRRKNMYGGKTDKNNNKNKSNKRKKNI